MSSQNTSGYGASVVARLLAGAPTETVDTAALAEPWDSVARSVAGAQGGDRLAAFEEALAKLPNSQANEVRLAVGRVGRSILRGEPEIQPARLGMTTTGVPELPEAARIAPALEQAGQGVGQWLTDYVTYAAEASERTPRLFHEATGLWVGGLAIARRLRLRLRHGDIYPNLYLIGCADTTLYAKSTGLEIGSRLINDALPHLLFANDFTPEALLADLAGREPTNLNSADMTQRDRELWLAGRSFAAQRGLVLEEVSSLFAGLRRDYMTGTTELLLRLYDCPGLYRRNTRGAGFVVVRNAYLSIIGMTTPARLRGVEINTAWYDGLFARFGLLTPETPPARPGQDFERPRPAYPPRLVETLTRLANSLLPVPCYPDCAEARDVDIDDEAKAAWWRYYTSLSYDLLVGQVPPAQELWGSYARLPSQGLKVALILAALDWASGQQKEPRVTLAHYARAQGIVEQWRASVHRLLDTLSGREVAAEYGKEDRILGLVRAAGTGGIAARDIYRSLKLRRADFDLLIDGLMRDGLVHQIQIESPHGPAATGLIATEHLSTEETGRHGDR